MSKNNSNQFDADNSSTAFSTDSVEDVILKLKTTIDRNFTDAKYVILELAKMLDETKQIKPRQICVRIKKIVRDEIAEGKITERWIEESLPDEYKRKYPKSELSSHLGKDKKEKKLVGSEEENLSNSAYSNSSDLNKSLQIQTTVRESDQQSNDTCTNCKELEETRRKMSSAIAEIDLPFNETRYEVPIEKYQEIDNAMKKNLKRFYVDFDIFTRSLLRVVSDKADK